MPPPKGGWRVDWFLLIIKILIFSKNNVEIKLKFFYSSHLSTQSSSWIINHELIISGKSEEICNKLEVLQSSMLLIAIFTNFQPSHFCV